MPPLQCLGGKKPQYKIIYFDARNLAEPARQILTYAKVPFEDVRVKHEDWPEVKERLPSGKVPVLEINGKQLCESSAIARYLANKYKLAGRNEWEKAKVDELVSLQKDFYAALSPWFYAKVGAKDPEKEPELFETVAKPVTERFFKLYSQLLRTHKGGFYVGNKETFVDFWIADFLYTLKNYAPELFEQHQDLLQHVERVQQLPQLKAYIENRPKRDF